MSKVVNISDYVKPAQDDDESVAQLLSELRAAVTRMDELGEELLDTKRKLIVADKKAQWARKSIDNLIGLCIGYIKSECNLSKFSEKKHDFNKEEYQKKPSKIVSSCS